MSVEHPPMTDPAWEARRAVGRWWRLKTAQDNQDTATYRKVLGDRYDGVMSQIAADIEHSSLLVRLLAGLEPEDRTQGTGHDHPGHATHPADLLDRPQDWSLMAVKQWFTIELPEGTIKEGELTLERAAAESLYKDLGEALGLGNVRGAEDGVQEALLAALQQLTSPTWKGETMEEPVGRQMSTEEALARVQAQEQMVPTPPARRNPGTGIGNG